MDLKQFRRRVAALCVGLTVSALVFAGLETGTYISDLVATNPLSSDLASTGDDHLRLIKSTVKATFPNINGAVSATDENLNSLSGALTAAGILELEAAAPRLIIDETDAAANERIYDFASSAGQLLGRTRTDADGAGASWLTVDRTGTTVDSIALASTALSVSGTSTFTASVQELENAAPIRQWDETDAAADERSWIARSTAGAWKLSTAADATPTTAASDAITIERTGTTVDSIALASTALSVSGTSTFTAQIQEQEHTTPTRQWDETDAPADERSWLLRATVGDMKLSLAADAAPTTPVADAITITRTGTTATSINLQATAVQINGNEVVRSSSGTYTPTISNTTNIDTCSAFEAQYMRVGSIVTVSGLLQCDATATSPTILDLSLPIASDLASGAQGIGVGAHSTAVISITSDPTDNEIQLDWIATATSNTNLVYHFTYRIL